MSKTSAPEIEYVEPKSKSVGDIIAAVAQYARVLSDEGREPEQVYIGVRLNSLKECRRLADPVFEGVERSVTFDVLETTAYRPEDGKEWSLVVRLYL